MENKQTAPKEIFISSANIEAINARGQKCGMFYTDKKHDTEVKYLSSTHVKELLSDKDKEINYLLKIVSERNAEIADINRYLDDKGYPSQDRYGNTYSIIERIENN